MRKLVGGSHCSSFSFTQAHNDTDTFPLLSTTHTHIIFSVSATGLVSPVCVVSGCSSPGSCVLLHHAGGKLPCGTCPSLHWRDTSGTATACSPHKPGYSGESLFPVEKIVFAPRSFSLVMRDHFHFCFGFVFHTYPAWYANYLNTHAHNHPVIVRELIAHKSNWPKTFHFEL